MAGMTVDGMISGMDTTAVVNQLVEAEAMGQTALKTRMSTAQQSAAAYRSVNSKFDALRTAAENVMKAASWTPAKATSTATSVSTTLGPTALPGSLTFSVLSTAAAHSVVGTQTYGAVTDPSGFGTSLDVLNADGTSRGTVSIGGTGTLADTVSAINKSDLGLTASAVQVSPGQYRMQVTSKESGEAKTFDLSGGEFKVTTAGTDAHLKVGTGPGAYDVRSPTNEFVGLMPGVTLKVSKPEAEATISIVSDPDTVAATMQALVDATNAALTDIKKQTANQPGSKAILAGDHTLTRMTSQVLSAVSSMVGTDGSPGVLGVSLTRDGTVTFDKAKFVKELTADPAKVQRVLAGTPGDAGVDGVAGSPDDVAAVSGTAARLLTFAKQVTDKSTGSLTLLAQGSDNYADDIKDRIADWDVRLATRRETLMRQFSAMEVSLSNMKSQSSWLSSQISSLPAA